MCGIVGILSLTDRAVDPQKLTRMRDTMIHRGPDGCGLWVEGNIGFGHRRLAIIDRNPNANQPMLSRDNQMVLCFNGEIYNHQSLRQTLIEEGFTD